MKPRMDTDGHGFLTANRTLTNATLRQGRRASLAKAQVLYEVGVPAVSGVAAEHLDDDCLYALGDLFACPGGFGGDCKIGFATHYPKGQVADRDEALWELGAEAVSGARREKAYDCYGHEAGHPGVYAQVDGFNCDCEARERGAGHERCYEPLRSFKSRGGDGQGCAESLNELGPLVGREEFLEGDGRSDAISVECPGTHAEGAEKIECPLRQTTSGLRIGGFYQNKVDELARGEEFFRFESSI